MSLYSDRNKKNTFNKVSAADEMRYFQKRMNEALNKFLVKEDEIKYPNMDNDVKEDIEKMKTALNNYLIDITPESYRFLNSNVICNGKVTIKNIVFGFSYSLDEEGCLISYPKEVNALPLYNEIITFFNDLKQYFVIWRDGWIEKLNSMKN